MQSPSLEELEAHLQTLDPSQFSSFVHNQLFRPVDRPDLSITHGQIPKPPRDECGPCNRSNDASFRCPNHHRLCPCSFKATSKSSWKDHLRKHTFGELDKVYIDSLHLSKLRNQATKSYEHFIYLQPNGVYWKNRLLKWLLGYTKDKCIDIALHIWLNSNRTARHWVFKWTVREDFTDLEELHRKRPRSQETTPPPEPKRRTSEPHQTKVNPPANELQQAPETPWRDTSTLSIYEMYGADGDVQENPYPVKNPEIYFRPWAHIKEIPDQPTAPKSLFIFSFTTPMNIGTRFLTYYHIDSTNFLTGFIQKTTVG